MSNPCQPQAGQTRPCDCGPACKCGPNCKCGESCACNAPAKAQAAPAA